MADAFLVFGILANADVQAIVVNGRRGDEIVARTARAQFVKGVLGIRIELPNEFASLRLEGIQPAVAARKNNLRLPVGFRIDGTGPLAVHQDQSAVLQLLEAGLALAALGQRFDHVNAWQIVAPDHLAGVLVQGQEAWGFGAGDIDVTLIDTVAGDYKEQVAHDQRRGAGEVVREDAQLVNHIELPDLLDLLRLGIAGDIGANDFAAVVDEVQSIAIDVGR